MIKPSGRHILAEFKCYNKKLLNDGKQLEAALVEAATKNNFSVKTNLYKFTPHGITAVAILGESHIIIHTYPEYNHVSLDCYTCFGNPNAIVNWLAQKLKLISLRSKEISRGWNILEIKQCRWMDAFLSPGAMVRYHTQKTLFHKKSKYQWIDIIVNDHFGKILFLDHDIQIAERDAHIYNRSLVSPIVKQGCKLNRVLVLGGGDGGVANELLKHGAGEIILVDIDGEVIKACKKFMPEIWGSALKNPKVKIIISDAYEYLGKADKKFDAIIYDLTASPEKFRIKMNQKDFLAKIFTNIKRNLSVKGAVTIQCCAESDKETLQEIKFVLKKNFGSINFVKTFIPSYCVNWIFANAILGFRQLHA